jgi:hypothetical protein
MFRLDGEVFLLGTAISAPSNSNKNCDDLRLFSAGYPAAAAGSSRTARSYSEVRRECKAVGQSVYVCFRPIADIRRSLHPVAVLRPYIAWGLLLVAGCNASREPPKSMCDLPRAFDGWENTSIRWKGILVDARPHGFLLVAGECKNRGISVGRLPEGAWDTLNQATQRGRREFGVIRIEVSGEITDEKTLDVSKIHRVAFDAMSEQQEEQFWQSKGF